MTDTLPTALYCRISARYAENEESLDSQQNNCLKRCVEEGLPAPDPDHIFREMDSGHETADERVVLLRLRELVRQGRIGHVVCYSTDRLSREPIELVSLWNEFKRAGCNTTFLLTPTDHTPAGKILLFMKGFADENEWLQIRERTTRKRREIRERGQRVGEGGARYGYQWVRDDGGRITKDRAWRIDPVSGAYVREIFTLVGDEGISMRQTAMILNGRGIPTPAGYRGSKYRDGRGLKWSNSGVRLILTDETYKGVSYTNKVQRVNRKRHKPRPKSEWKVIATPNTPPIVDEELWARANMAIKANDIVGQRRKAAAATRNNDEFVPFRGIISCAVCGEPLTVVKTKKWNKATKNHEGGGFDTVYRCQSRRWAAENLVPPEDWCYARPVHDRKIRDRVWAKVVEFINDERLIESEIERLKSDRPGEGLFRESLAAAKAEVAACGRRVKNLVTSMAEEDDDDVRRAIREKITSIKEEKVRNEGRAAKLEEKLTNYDALDHRADELRGRSAEIREGLADPSKLTWPERRHILDWLDARIVAAGEDVTIRLDSGLELPAGDDKPLSVQGGLSRKTNEDRQRQWIVIEVSQDEKPRKVRSDRAVNVASP